MRSPSLVLVLVLGSTGCATTVLGPDPSATSNQADVAGTAEFERSSPLAFLDEIGLTNVLLTYQPGNLGYGPHTGLSRSAEDTLARSIEIVANRTDMAEVVERTVYIPGFRGPRPPELTRRADIVYVAAQIAERVVQAHGRVALDRRDADFIVFPWIQVLSGITTHREYRSYGYPLYLHEEDQRPAWIMVFLYDKKRGVLEVLEGDRTWQVRIDSYILGIFPVEWFLGF